MPLDIRFVRENADLVRDWQAKRFLPVENVDAVLAKDAEWRRHQSELDDMRKLYAQTNKQIGAKKKAHGDATAEIEAAVELDRKIAEAVIACNAEQEEVQKLLRLLGNSIHESVPIEKDEKFNRVERTWGTPRVDKTLKHHHELLHMIEGYEPERGAAIAGHRAYYLTGPGVLLNMALVQYGLHFMTKRGYKTIQPPYFMNREVMAGVAQLSEYDEELYKVTGEAEDGDKYLIATSEQPLCGYNMGEWLQDKDLPRRYCGYSTCFRKEAGSHGKDTWGIFRVHQFEKVEQFCITAPEKSWETQEEMIKTAEEFYQSLKLAYRVVNIVSGEVCTCPIVVYCVL